MEDPIEEAAWYLITDSAKNKINYTAFKDIFPFDPDLLIFKVILGFADGKSISEIQAILFNDVLMTGFIWPREEIEDFLKDKRELWKNEIATAKIATGMLLDGVSSQQVLDLVYRLI